MEIKVCARVCDAMATADQHRNGLPAHYGTEQLEFATSIITLSHELWSK